MDFKLGDSLMNKINFDKIYQSAVDNETDKFFSYSIDELLHKGDYGSIKTLNQVNIGWWKWKYGESRCHIVVKAQRKLCFGFCRNYLNGIKFDVESGVVEYLSKEEIGGYD